ncbi:unnamed protein product [Calypogeia fissa]
MLDRLVEAQDMILEVTRLDIKEMNGKYDMDQPSKRNSYFATNWLLAISATQLRESALADGSSSFCTVRVFWSLSFGKGQLRSPWLLLGVRLPT